MPLIQKSTYVATGVFKHPHVNTVFPALFRKIKGLHYQRERIFTPDQDFLDLDWVRRQGNDRLIIVLHGLEGNANRPYVRGLIKHFHLAGWDGIGMNFRGCSGELNQQLRSYHMGSTDDLALVVKHVLTLNRYKTILLSGFSLGGNVVLNYLGQQGANTPSEIKGAVTFSVPCHIRTANDEINRWDNGVYRYRFIKGLYKKIEEKADIFPDEIKLFYPKPRYFKEFDDLYTAPINGFEDAYDYWEKCSSLYVIPNIKVPTLLVNAKDDTFLSASCYPAELAEAHKHFYLEAPEWGGHVGFVSFNKNGAYWSEINALRFVEEVVNPH